MNHRLACLLILAVGLTACTASQSRLRRAAQAGDEVVVAEGSAPYKADDIPGTKDAALAAAQRSAVEKVVGVYVSARVRVDKAIAIEQSILTHSAGYIRKYDILSQGRQGDWYHTQIRALVSTKIVHEDLDTLGLLHAPGVGNPRIALIVSEHIADEPPAAAGASQRVLSEALLQQGFQVVDLPRSADDADATDLARSLTPGLAELIFSGEARAENLGYSTQQLGGMSSYRATLNGRVLEAGTGQVLATVAQSASGLDATPAAAAAKAFENAAQAAAQDLAGLPQQLSERAHVQITLNGVQTFDMLNDFQTALGKVREVKDQYLRSYGQSNGIAVIDVQTSLSPQQLANAVAHGAVYGWTVGQVVGRSVQMTAPNPAAGH